MRRHRVAGVLLAAAAAIVCTAGAARAEFGAFAYDLAAGKYGYSWNETNQKAADAAAVKGCGTAACKVVFRTGPHQCGAIATTGNGKVWGGARRPSRDAAKLAAVEDCEKRTKEQCVLRANECNR